MLDSLERCTRLKAWRVLSWQHLHDNRTDPSAIFFYARISDYLFFLEGHTGECPSRRALRA